MLGRRTVGIAWGSGEDEEERRKHRNGGRREEGEEVVLEGNRGGTANLGGGGGFGTYDNMHINVMFYALNCINTHVLSC